MQDVAINEMERCVKDLGLHGIEIGTNVNGNNFDDPALIEFFAGNEKYLFLYIHGRHKGKKEYRAIILCTQLGCQVKQL